jgi:hypothetical protein
LKTLQGFKIPKVQKRKLEMSETPPTTSSFPTTTPGVGSSQEPGSELLKRARAMRFEGRSDRGGIGQQLVLAGFHQMPLQEKLRFAAELDSVETQEAPDAPQAELDALISIFERPYAKWGPAYPTQLLTMFPKPKNSSVGPAPRFK